jgi:hypothetical protein
LGLGLTLSAGMTIPPGVLDKVLVPLGLPLGRIRRFGAPLVVPENACRRESGGYGPDAVLSMRANQCRNSLAGASRMVRPQDDVGSQYGASRYQRMAT